ncbi:MAG: tRNA (adenosine(37)-N6)-dimethylallyltransferase MiaA [Clostridiales bacterium]|nr:tRNA (adenosine(37)-N6)-dimethylallyltransferase MiaA [Clostridiales bacterium]
MSDAKPPKIAVITGPTATGKSTLGILLAKELDGEVVSADSMQIYRSMDIGTAKVTPDETQGVPHHMLDVAEPTENWSVARYVAEADKCVCDILRRGKLPVIVGGTGLYIDSLIAGLEFAASGTDETVRRELSEKYDRLGGEAMLKLLAEIDPDRADRLHPSDKKRITRALEVFYLTGKTISQHDAETRKTPPRYDAVKIALSFENREQLYSRIDARVDKMVEQGLFEEVRSLLGRGVPEKCTAMQAIGYKETAQALRGEISEETAIDTIKRESRRYAKRQLTWLRRDKSIMWILWKMQPDFENARQISTNCIISHGLE